MFEADITESDYVLSVRVWRPPSPTVRRIVAIVLVVASVACGIWTIQRFTAPHEIPTTTSLNRIIRSEPWSSSFTEEDYTIPLELRRLAPAAFVGEIEREIRWLEQSGHPLEAAAFQTRLSNLVASLEGPYFQQQSDEPQLHVVIVDEGVEQTNAQRAGQFDRTNVHVTYTGAPITLALGAKESVDWCVELAEGVQLERVIFGGRKPQRVAGLPAEIPVEEISEKDLVASPYLPWGKQSVNGVESLEKLLDQKATTIQRERHYVNVDEETGKRSPGTCVVGIESSPWATQIRRTVLRSLLHEVSRLHAEAVVTECAGTKVPGVEIKLAYAQNLTHGSDYQNWNTTFCFFTLFGSMIGDEVSLDQSLFQVAFDPVGSTLFGIKDKLYTVDPRRGRGRVTELPIPEINAVLRGKRCNIAVDSKRQRLLINSDQLYAYDLTTQKLATLAEGTASPIVHCPQKDLIYSVSGGSITTINHRGATIATTGLSSGVARDHVAISGNYVITFDLTKSYDFQGEPRRLQMKTGKSYIIEPSSGRVIAVCNFRN